MESRIIFTQTTDELGGQTFSGFQEHPFKAATVQKTLLYSVLKLRIKLDVNFFFTESSSVKAIACLFVFSYQEKKKQLLRLGTFGFFLYRTAQHNLNSWQTNANLTNAA